MTGTCCSAADLNFLSVRGNLLEEIQIHEHLKPLILLVLL